MSEYYWVFQYPKEALFYFINELKLNGGLSLESYKAMDNGGLVKHIMADPQGLEKLADYIDRVKIFQNAKYMDCWKAAFPEDGNICMKTSYGAGAYNKYGALMAFANNRPIGQAAGNGSTYCSDCANSENKKTSRLSLDGCDYAVGWLLAKLFDLGYQPSNINELEIYEAGFSVQQGFKPLWYSENIYPCQHCLKIFLAFGVQMVWEVVQNYDQIVWYGLSEQKDFLRAV